MPAAVDPEARWASWSGRVLLPLLVVVVLSAPGVADPVKGRAPRRGWSLEGRVRAMLHAWDFFNPGGSAENAYRFLGLRSRLRLRFDRAGLGGLAELQDVQLADLPAHAIAPAAGGQLGFGASDFAHALRPSINTMGVRQAWLRVDQAAGSRLQIGRFDYASAMEVTCDDAKLEWLKRARLKDRLIGTFDFSDFSRSFDGARFDIDWPVARLTGFAAHPTQGGFEPHFSTDIDRFFVSNLALTVKRSRWLPASEGQAFWMHSDDTRDVPDVDNRPVAKRGRVGAQGGLHLDTFGFHFVTRLGRQGDGLLWYAHQTGKWGTLTHAADAFSAELGWQIARDGWKPWLRAGYSQFSGDGNPNDRRHGTFVAPLPTTRLFARFPFYTMSNLHDLFAQLVLSPHPSTAVRLDLHLLRLDQASDLWYAGSGATQRGGSINGYAGRPSGGATGLGTVLDLSIDHRFNANHALGFYVGHVFGGGVERHDFPAGRDASYAFLQYDLKLP